MIHERVAAAERGENPAVICRMRAGYLVLCDMQTARAWCILLPTPVVSDLTDLDEAGRTVFLSDMAAAGEAILKATGAYRMNYSILGNTDPALHAHLHPRFSDEPDELRRQPLWAVWSHLTKVDFDPARDSPLMGRIHDALIAAGRCRCGERHSGAIASTV